MRTGVQGSHVDGGLEREGRQRETGCHRLGPPGQTLTVCSSEVLWPGRDRGAAVPDLSFLIFAAPEPSPGPSGRRHREKAVPFYFYFIPSGDPFC